MTKSRYKAFYGGIWYNKTGQVIFGVEEAWTPGQALNQFTRRGERPAYEGMEMLGISADPILSIQANSSGWMMATKYNRWLRKTAANGTTMSSDPWTKTGKPKDWPLKENEPLMKRNAELRMENRGLINALKTANDSVDRLHTRDDILMSENGRLRKENANLKLDLEHAKDQIDELHDQQKSEPIEVPKDYWYNQYQRVLEEKGALIGKMSKARDILSG